LLSRFVEYRQSPVIICGTPDTIQEASRKDAARASTISLCARFNRPSRNGHPVIRRSGHIHKDAGASLRPFAADDEVDDADDDDRKQDVKDKIHGKLLI
jgi:hypothetical protein